MKYVMAELYIDIDLEVCGGKPVIKGTRVPLEFIVKMLRAGVSPDKIHEEYPTVPVEVIWEISRALNEGRELEAKLVIR
ncbi:MAG: DUF433 domain-containing protein [Nitrososphaerales archaeon]